MTDEKKKRLHVETGTLLAAWPDLRDPNFMHAVLLMCQHSEHGAYGLVVNRPSDLQIANLFPDHPMLGKIEFPVHIGGPVDHTALQFVHTVPEVVGGGVALDEELFLGGELEALGHFLVENPDRARGSVRVFLGYSGWGAGQLEGELAVGSWVPAPPDREAVFSNDPETTWKRVLRTVDPGEAGLQDQPPDVSWN